MRVRVVLADGQTALLDPRLEVGKLLRALGGTAFSLLRSERGDLLGGRGLAELVGRLSFDVSRIAQVEEGVLGHRRVVEDAMEDL